jgi:hypothetical protein
VSYRISGQIQPKIAGIVVQLNGGASATTDASGNFAFVISEKSPGFRKYQLTTLGNEVVQSASTQPINVLVR